MATSSMRFKLNKSGRTACSQPVELKKMVVADLEAGFSFEAIQDKYGKVRRQTLKDWVLQYGTGKTLSGIAQRIPVHVKRQALFELETGILTMAEAVKKYQIREYTLSKWLAGQQLSIGNSVTVEEQPTTMDNAEKKALQQQLAELKLKVTALETMIDLAEQQYNFPIRKKFGTKQ